jgi:N-acetylmuramoyl-L-alanine amidase
VGIQVGHWQIADLPDELARLRGSGGAVAAGFSEVQVNLAIARRVIALLQSDGIAADLLPATVPPGYNADAFVAIHADGASRVGPRGFKLATPWRTSRASQHLLDAMTAEYGAVTGLPQDGSITANMRGYYAFSYRRFAHTIAKTTPAVIVETGFITSAADRQILIGRPDLAAVGIANGIIRYLNERDPNDTAALVPPEFALQWAISPDGVDIRAAPNDAAHVLGHAQGHSRLIPIQEHDGWYQVVYSRDWRIVGWVRKDQVQPTGEPLPSPPPATDS